MQNPSVRHRMWQSMRILKMFDRDDVASTAEASVNTVRVYLRSLMLAGFLRQQGTGSEAIFILARDTGPKPPAPVYERAGKSNLRGVTDLNTGVTHELA
ncbi:hypothetical protein [Aeromonas enteropelogenes]|uniref:hypothetical protein n=1 Tax=Aeromonas enteropelogenes TaxID=29489 RepID=UPI003BA138D8